MKKLFLLLIIILTTTSAQEIKLIKRTMTDAEFIKFKKSVGTYEEGKNYNKIINGHGTGLKPPIEEQWKEMKNQPILIDRIEPLGTTELPSSCDNSATNWFPPIGNQGSEGSCVSWVLYKNFSGGKRTQLGSFWMCLDKWKSEYCISRQNIQSSFYLSFGKLGSRQWFRLC